jgi:hypothetical protein
MPQIPNIITLLRVAGSEAEVRYQDWNIAG